MSNKIVFVLGVGLAVVTVKAITVYLKSRSKAKNLNEIVEEHERIVLSGIRGRSVANLQELNTEHMVTVQQLTDGLADGEKRDLVYLLNCRWWNMLAKEQEWYHFEDQRESRLCLHLSTAWVNAVAFTERLGNVNVTFDRQDTYASGFDPYNELDHSWIHDIVVTGSLYDLIARASIGSVRGGRKTIAVIARVKHFVDQCTNENISRLVLITTARFSNRERLVLQNCCQKAGFGNVSMLSETALIARRILSELEPDEDNLEVVSVLVVDCVCDPLRLEVYGRDENGEIKMLTAVVEQACTLISIRNAYIRAMLHLSTSGRNSLRYYTLLWEVDNDFFDSVHQHLAQENGLTYIAV